MKQPFALSLAVAVSAATASLAGACLAEEHIVEIRSLAFIPDEVVARPGDSVTWINRDIVPHTATARDHRWNTGEIEPGGRETLELPTAFRGEYFCIYHPAMRGTLQGRASR